MINIRTEFGHTKTTIKGNIATLCADTCILLNAIYDTIKSKIGEEDAKQYREIMERDLITYAFKPDAIKEKLLSDPKTAELVKGLDAIIDLFEGIY